MGLLKSSLVIVYPARGNAFYAELASRLYTAARALDDKEVHLLSSDAPAYHRLRFREFTAAIVNPNECLLSGHRALSWLHECDARLAIIAESVDTQWYRNNFNLGFTYAAVVDVGFVSQEIGHAVPAVPYRFLFNAPTDEERQVIASRRPGPRAIRWTVVGHYTEDRLQLVAKLIEQGGSNGVVFLPTLRPIRRDNALLSPAAVRSVLARTAYYVWCAHHAHPYYESFRFLDCALTGAAPCKLDASAARQWAVPGVHVSVDTLCEQLRQEDSWPAYEAARRFCLSRGSLTDVLHDVLASL